MEEQDEDVALEHHQLIAFAQAADTRKQKNQGFHALVQYALNATVKW